MKIKNNFNLSLDKFINLSLYNKNFGYYMKKIHLAVEVILLQLQIFQDFFLR